MAPKSVGMAPRTRLGLSLMEVLVAMFVVTIGLLSLASLIPLGIFSVREASKADRGGTCGRAALRQIKIQRMLDVQNWYAKDAAILDTCLAPDEGPFVIDPLGYEEGSSPWLGSGDPLGNEIPRITLRQYPGADFPMPLAVARRTFIWQDDREFILPDDMNDWPHESSRPQSMELIPSSDPSQPNPDPSQPSWIGNFSWFITVSPARSEGHLYDPDSVHWQRNKRFFCVSAVVCYKRKYTSYQPTNDLDKMEEQFETGGEFVRTATFLSGGDVAIGGGSVKLDQRLVTREHEWILLCDRNKAIWYRIISAGTMLEDNVEKSMLTLAGPDWTINDPDNPQVTAILVDRVVGVYSTTVELDGE